MIVDKHQQSKSLKELVDPPMLERMACWKGVAVEDLQVNKYSDLEGLPCILILCEKGKMGDTFPRSLRFYDLRLRYANSWTQRAAAVQDLGRAFRYVSPGQEHEVPVVLLGAACHREIKNSIKGRKTGSARGLLRVDPDYGDKMKKVKKGLVQAPGGPLPLYSHTRQLLAFPCKRQRARQRARSATRALAETPSPCRRVPGVRRQLGRVPHQLAGWRESLRLACAAPQGLVQSQEGQQPKQA